MATPSNLYAEKVYSEHPLALWALDDKVDFLSLITEAQRDIEDTWVVTGGTAGTSVSSNSQPFVDSIVSFIDCDVPDTAGQAILISEGLEPFVNFDPLLGSFAISFYAYTDSAFITSISLGYEYTNHITEQVIQEFKDFDSIPLNGWSFFSHTFSIDQQEMTPRLIIKINTTAGGITEDQYRIFINGISFGQWSEEFYTQSLGADRISIPNTISGFTNQKGVAAYPYGLSDDIGYYVINNGLRCRNTSIPIVFGASNVTKILPNNSLPSLIIPGKGFLNEAGRYRDYSAEFWIRINSDSENPFRIFGPVASSDGLYVDKTFVTLSIGDKFQSHFVGEWYRPMLVQIIVLENLASVIINGEEVISMQINSSSLSLPAEYDSSGKSQDWLGFYSSEDVSPFEIDCIGIYPYQIPIKVAKRRFVYGQAVGSQEKTDSSFDGTSVSIDYSFSNYASNYMYPDYAKWSQGDFDNLAITNSLLKVPTYSLPNIFTSDKTTEELYLANKEIQDDGETFITFRPNSEWDNVNCYFNFQKFNMINDEIHTIYAVIEITEDDSSMQTIIDIKNNLTGDRFSVRKDHGHIDYYLTVNENDQEIYLGGTFNLNEKISVGIDITNLSDTFGEDVALFFGNRNVLSMYVGGDETGNHTFTGKIYSVGISTAYDRTLIQDYFDTNGGIEFTHANELLAHTASYTLLPTEKYSNYFLDIGVSGYWEDYVPLSYFAKYIAGQDGSKIYDLDFLQVNLDYPRPSKFIEQEQVDSSFTLNDLKNEYSNPVSKQYQELDNSLLSGWNDYQDMKENSSKIYSYDTSNALIKTYVSFQYIENGANMLRESFTDIISVPQNNVLDVSNYTNWLTTKFEVVSGTIIYPPSNVNFNDVAIICHVEFNTRSTLHGDLFLKRLQIASQVFNDNSFNAIGTKFGIDIYPYKKAGIYYNYKDKNPFKIYKGSSPYLYMTRDTGIQLCGDFSSNIERGIAIPVNKQKASNYNISAIQAWLRYDYDKFSAIPTQIFEIAYNGDTVKIYMVAENQEGGRARIYAIQQSTGLEVSGIAYYWNGILVNYPYITAKEWGVLGIRFAQQLPFSPYPGKINITGPITVNNISLYKANNLRLVQKDITRPWIDILVDNGIDRNWDYWDSYKWRGILVLATVDAYSINPEDIYKTYVGTNRIVFDDSSGLLFNPEQISIYKDSSWQVSTITPA